MLYHPKMSRLKTLIVFREYNKETDRFGGAIGVPGTEVMVATGEVMTIHRGDARFNVMRLYSPSAGLVWIFSDQVSEVREKKVSPQPVQE